MKTYTKHNGDERSEASSLKHNGDGSLVQAALQQENRPRVLSPRVLCLQRRSQIPRYEGSDSRSRYLLAIKEKGHSAGTGTLTEDQGQGSRSESEG